MFRPTELKVFLIEHERDTKMFPLGGINENVPFQSCYITEF